MFFGRSREIETILASESTDFVVLGSRRIGKSSLLRFLEKATAVSEERLPIYIDCSRIENYHDLSVRIAEHINIRRARRIQLSTLGQMVRASFSVRKVRYMLLLDEIDKLVLLATRSNDWAFFEALRELSNTGVAQSFFQGTKACTRLGRILRALCSLRFAAVLVHAEHGECA